MGKISRGRFDARVLELTDGTPALSAATEPVLNARRALRSELARLETHIRHHAGADPVCRLLMTMPGVGAIVALTFKSAIDDPERFHASKDVGPWVGLTPRREQSGERDIIGQITRAGDAALRTALHQAATVMLNHGRPNWLTAWALRVAQRRGKKRATVALARRSTACGETQASSVSRVSCRRRRRRKHRRPPRLSTRRRNRLRPGRWPTEVPSRDAVPDDAGTRLVARHLVPEHAVEIGTREPHLDLA